MRYANSFLSSTIKIGLSGAGAQVVIFLSLPVIARVYDANAFGVWSLIQSASLLVGAVATCRYELAVVLPDNRSDAANLLGAGLAISLLITIVSALLLPVISPLLFNDQDVASASYWAIPLLVFFLSAYQLALSWHVRNEYFTLYGIAQLLFAVGMAGFPLLFSFISTAPIWLIVGNIAAAIFVSIILWAKIILDMNKSDGWHVLGPREFWTVAVKYKNYPFYMMPYTLLSILRERLIFFLLGSYSGVNQVGLYSMAQRLTNAPNSLAASALRPVFFQRVAQGDPQNIPSIINEVMLWLLLLVIPPVVFYYHYPVYSLELFFGEGWGDSSSYVMLLLIAVIPLMMGNWMDRYFDALGKQRLAFTLELIFTVILLLGLVIAFSVGATAIQAVAVQAIIMAVYFVIWIWVLFKIAGIPKTIFWRNALVLLILGAASYAYINLVSRYTDFWVSLMIFMAGWIILLYVNLIHSKIRHNA